MHERVSVRKAGSTLKKVIFDDFCLDINECALTPDLCGNGTCVNIPGAFRCNCQDGFKNAPMMREVCIGMCC